MASRRTGGAGLGLGAEQAGELARQAKKYDEAERLLARYRAQPDAAVRLGSSTSASFEARRSLWRLSVWDGHGRGRGRWG